MGNERWRMVGWKTPVRAVGRYASKGVRGCPSPQSRSWGAWCRLAVMVRPPFACRNRRAKSWLLLPLAVLLSSCTPSIGSDAIGRALDTTCGSAWATLKDANDLLFAIVHPDSTEGSEFLDRFATSVLEVTGDTAPGLAEIQAAPAGDAAPAKRLLLQEIYGFLLIDGFRSDYTREKSAAGVIRLEPILGVPQRLVYRAEAIDDRTEDLVLLWDTWEFPVEIPAATLTVEYKWEVFTPDDLVLLCDPDRDWAGISFNEDFTYLVSGDPLDLSGAVFDGSDLSGSTWGPFTMDGASFRQSDLSRTTFEGTSLRGADFTGAELDSTFFFDADLTDARLASSEGTYIRGGMCPSGRAADQAGDDCDD